jgi:hypothetical protein
MSTDEKFGFTLAAWERAKTEAVRAMVQAGKNDVLLTYSELASHIASIRIEPHDFAMDRLLDEVSKDEHVAGRALLTALVVLKETRIPAQGFWSSAADIGCNVKDKLDFWQQEVARVMQECKTRNG